MACIAMANACVAAATSIILLPKSVKLSPFPLPSAHVCGVGFFPVMRPCSTSPHRSAALQLQAVKKGGVEPDLCEDYVDIWATPGEGQEDLFPWGKADGAHSWHEGDDGTFIEGIREVLDSAGGPTGFQANIPVSLHCTLHFCVHWNRNG
ncbi:hypothetical protein O6H91_17G029200 [Diphasiastrum complanatum]|uniref:Uncharacterized protein n=1 Tax=Diphasiastrum complanatum TaxID=34168 RepID=A0ACC2B5D6_DIPCM|nr:hypothetical protein O6H91_17G029200 [Diphasiastrum complanatum]